MSDVVVGLCRRSALILLGTTSAILTLGVGRADAQTVIPYSRAPDFNRRLSAAMRSGIKIIKVPVSPPARSRIPPELKGWIDRVLHEGGEVRWRDDTKGRGFWPIVIGAILGALAEKGLDYLIERFADPAKNYNAIIAFALGEKDDATYVVGVEFYAKTSAAWIEAVGNSKATR